jgi:hypothetical protein
VRTIIAWIRFDSSQSTQTQRTNFVGAAGQPTWLTRSPATRAVSAYVTPRSERNWCSSLTIPSIKTRRTARPVRFFSTFIHALQRLKPDRVRASRQSPSSGEEVVDLEHHFGAWQEELIAKAAVIGGPFPAVVSHVGHDGLRLRVNDQIRLQGR